MKKFVLIITFVLILLGSYLFFIEKSTDRETWIYRVIERPNNKIDASFVECINSTGEKYLVVIPWYLLYKEDQLRYAEKRIRNL